MVTDAGWVGGNILWNWRWRKGNVAGNLSAATKNLGKITRTLLQAGQIFLFKTRTTTSNKTRDAHLKR